MLCKLALWSANATVMAFSYIGLVLFALATAAEAYRDHYDDLAA